MQPITNIENANYVREKLIPLIVPNLFPDELFEGNVGRLGLRNGYQDFSLTKDYLRKAFVTRCQRPYDYALELQMSELHNISVENLTKNHTLIPLTRSLFNFDIANDDFKNLVVRRKTSAKQYFYFCKECIKEDLDFHGESYWRRSHQINGIEICTKHQKLRVTAKDPFAFFSSPEKVMESKSYYENKVTDEDLNNPIIIKYNELIEDYIHLNNPLNFKAISQLLSSHAKANQLRIAPKGKALTLSNYLFKHVPHSWLIKNFPCFWRKNTVDYIHDIDSVFLSSYPNNLYSYLIAIAALIPDAESKILTYDKFTTSKKYKNTEDAGVEDNDLITSYKNNKGDYARVVLELNLPRSLIERELKKLGLPPLGQYHNHTRKALHDFFHGVSLSELYKRNGVNFDQVFEALRESSKIKDINFI